MHRIAKTLKADFAQQLGNKKDRPAALKFEAWKHIGRAKAAALRRPASMVLSLDLFQVARSSWLVMRRTMLRQAARVCWLRDVLY